MTSRIDLIDREFALNANKTPRLVGYGYRLSEDFDEASLAFLSSLCADAKTHDAGYKNGSTWHKPNSDVKAKFVAESSQHPSIRAFACAQSLLRMSGQMKPLILSSR